jgi:hypothetical protein
MTASKRYLPASVACLLTLSAGSQAIAGGGSSLDPYAYVSAPTSTKGGKKEEKGKKQHNIPIIKKAQAEEKLVGEDPNQSQTYVKMPGGGKSKKQKEVTFAPEATKPAKESKFGFLKKSEDPKPTKAAAIAAPAPKPAPTTTKVSDVAPAAVKAEKPVVSGQGEESVIGGIKTIGEGYSKTFKAATHGVMHSTKAASSAVMAGSKKMTSGIKSSAKASGDAFKKSADIVGHGFKATGDKLKDSAAPLTNKIAKAPDKEKEKAPKADKAPKAAKPEATKVAKAPKETPITNDEPPAKQGMLSHIPKPKIPKIGIPFMGGKKKAPVVDAQAGANELGGQAPDTNVAAKPKQSPLAPPAPKETPIVDTPLETAQTPAPAPKAKSPGKIKGSTQGIASMPVNAAKKIGKLWPFGHKNAAPQGADVAGKQTPPQM